MGCSDSTAIDNHVYVRNQHALRNPHEFPKDATDEFLQSSQLKLHSKDSQISMNVKKQSSLGQDLFQNSEEYLEELYTFCEGNLDKFFSQLQQKISEIYMSISKDTLEQMNQNVLINNESKIQISEEILWFNLNILKVASRKNEHKFNPTIFKQINKLQKNLVGYLKMKYPRGGQSFVPGDLMAVFKEFDLSEDLQFDILKNANIYFGSQNDADLSRDIKIFLNKLMNETDLNYPKFQKLMQERVFVVQGEDGEKKTLNYKIGRKIPENVPKYTDLDNNMLEINSPEIFRVIIKWMEYLEEIFISPNENINKKKNFKCFIEQNEKGVNVYDEINEDQYFDLINYELIEKIEKEKTHYNDQNSSLLKDMDRFNSHLIKLLDTSVRRQKFVPVREMETIKYSNLNAKFIAWVLGEKLMLALKKLIKVGKSFYDTKSMLNLDLIQFRVSDLMRSMVSGSKKQILAVYANLKNLQKQGLIKIIKIKNRLGTSLNDAMIIFAMKDTFLICEIQLILSDSTQKVNQKYKNIELLNHFFYELQRSPYGILSEIAVLLAYKDSKVSYEDNITFEINKLDLADCDINHPKNVVEIKEQTKPFICTKCTKFYSKFENIFIMKHCDVCNVFVCAKCIFTQDKELERSVINRELCVEVDRAVAKTLSKLRAINSSTGASTILEMFESPFKKLEDIFGPKKVQISKLREYLSTQVKNAVDDVFFVIVGFRTGRAVLKQLIFKPMWKDIINPFNPKEQFLDKKFVFYTNYDLILFYNQATFKNKQSFFDITENMLHLYASEHDFLKVFEKKVGLLIRTFKIADFRVVINIEKDTKIMHFESTQERQDASWKKWINKCTKTFKYASLHQATAGLPDLAGAKSILKLSDLGIIDNHLQFFKEINWTLSIKELKLSKNKLKSVAIILQVCTQLQRLYINQNFIKEMVFTKNLPMIEIINGVNNEILKLSGCQKIKNISKLLLEGNMLEEFPKSEFPNIKILNLKKNPICNFQTVYQSTLPNIQQLYLDYQEQNQCSNIRPNNEIDLEKVVLPFEKLKSIQSESNFTEISIMSKKIQRMTFYRNDLKNINLLSFESLKYVTLSDNKIESVEFLFNPKFNYENNVIVEIDMHKNQLSQLPLMKSTSLLIANFSQNQISILQSLSSSTISNLKSIDFSSNQIEQIPEMSFPKLEKMLLSSNPVKNMEKLENSRLESLELLEFSNCGFVENFPLLSMASLKEISMVLTDLQKMENLSASKLPKLKKLTFSYCTIQKFPILSIDSLEHINLSNSTIFDFANIEKCQLPNLKSLILAYVTIENQETDEVVDNNKEKNIFSCHLNFPKLELLKLDGANFKNMEGLQKSNLPILNELSIQYCTFNKYPKLCMQNLKRIMASNCQIVNIETLLTPALNSIQAIYLDSNLIQKVNLSLPQIKIVDLGFNLIKEFLQTGLLDCLEQLNLQRNGLTIFPCLKAPNLKKLSVNQNPFNDIQNLKLCKLDSLEELRLSGCELQNAFFPVVDLPSIKSLYILESFISDVQNLSQSKMSTLQDINFSNNKIVTLPVMKFPELKFLRFNSNHLEDVSNLEFCVCPELTIIQLETNNLKSLPKMPFPNLKKIFAHQNNFLSVEEFNKSQFKDFQILNICQNHQLQQWPMFKNSCGEIYLNQTKLIDVVHVNEFKGLKRIQMNGNQIKIIPKLNFRQLQSIQFQDNCLQEISEFAKGQYPECTQFSLKGNQLKKLPLIKMQKLKKAYFNQNLLEDIEEFLQLPMPDLETLTFDNNHIKKVKNLLYPSLNDVYFTGNRELEQLTCFNLPQYNQLKMIVAASTGVKKVQKLPKMFSLEKIWVNDSKLEDIQWLSESAPNLPKLQFINVSNNQIRVLPALEFKSLTSLYITNNQIEDNDKFVKMDKVYFVYASVFSLSIKCQTDEEFEKKKVQLQERWPSIQLSRFQ